MSNPEAEASPVERLHVRISHSGLCSRRKAEQLILEGRVTVNDRIVIELGTKVSEADLVAVDGVPIQAPKRGMTILLNKPKGVLTTMHDPHGRPTIVQFLPSRTANLKPVGRLDKETEGLLLCTSDGDLAHRLTHPRYGVEKEYIAIVDGLPDEKAIQKLRSGVFIEGGKTSPAQVEVIHAEPKTNTTGLNIVIHEGRKRQIRLMCEAVGHPVRQLKRVRIGPLRIKGMKPGEARLLGKKDVDELRRMVDLEVED
jgi:pseudouridine synthase